MQLGTGVAGPGGGSRTQGGVTARPMASVWTRLNGAVIKGFEKDVGTKTSFYGFTVNTMKNSLLAYRTAGFTSVPRGQVRPDGRHGSRSRSPSAGKPRVPEPRATGWGLCAGRELRRRRSGQGCPLLQAALHRFRLVGMATSICPAAHCPGEEAKHWGPNPASPPGLLGSQHWPCHLQLAAVQGPSGADLGFPVSHATPRIGGVPSEFSQQPVQGAEVQ